MGTQAAPGPVKSNCPLLATGSLRLVSQIAIPTLTIRELLLYVDRPALDQAATAQRAVNRRHSLTTTRRPMLTMRERGSPLSVIQQAVVIAGQS
jgi:hypothetical protein